jgi:predicted transcriptional regulator
VKAVHTIQGKVEMLMTTELTPLQQVLLNVLRGANDWMSRSKIADELERPNRLNPHDVKMLERLVDDGLVEKSKRVLSGATVQTEYIYRTID